MMPEATQLNDQWVLEVLTDIAKKLAKLPEIESHLVRQNTSIEKTIIKCAGLDLRVHGLERARDARTGRWRIAGRSALKIFEGVVLALMLWQLLGRS